MYMCMFVLLPLTLIFTMYMFFFFSCRMLEEIIEDNPSVSSGEKYLCSLTTMERSVLHYISLIACDLA